MCLARQREDVVSCNPNFIAISSCKVFTACMYVEGCQMFKQVAFQFVRNTNMEGGSEELEVVYFPQINWRTNSTTTTGLRGGHCKLGDVADESPPQMHPSPDTQQM